MSPSQAAPNDCSTDPDDFILYPYVENGQAFTVVQDKRRPIKDDLTADGPFESLNRDGRYLIPTNYFKDVVLVPSITADMFRQQRSEILLRKGDVVITTFPRSGTTWTEQVVLLLLQKGDPTHLNTKEKNSYDPSNPNSPCKVFLDYLYHPTPMENFAAPWGHTFGKDRVLKAKDLDAIEDQRVFKTHHLAHMVIGMGEASEYLAQKVPPPPTPGLKFIWVIRNPKDIVFSMMRINTTNYEKHNFPLAPFVKAFLNGKTNRGDWAEHTREWLRYSKDYPQNVLPVFYEDCKKSPLESARRIAAFIGADITEDELLNSVKYSSFESMKKMSAGAEAEHVHHGHVGGWRSRMSKEMIAAFDKMLDDESLGEIGRRYCRAD